MSDDQQSSASKRARTSIIPRVSQRPLNEDELKLELKIYYDRLFPVSFLFHWLSTHAPQDGLKYREMSFTLPGDIYVRYCSYLTKEALKNDLVSKLPVKIDIGAIYNAPPNMHASIQNFAPVQKELVFDIDMTDYDDIRTCCSEAKVCEKCWVLMSAAIKVIHTILTRDFGFEHIMWIFSGRRGVHCWICDPRARKLTYEQRSAIVDFLSVYAGKEKKVDLGKSTIHPSLNRAYEQLLPYFEELLETQGWLDTNEKSAKILEYFDPAVRDEFRWDNEDDAPAEKWLQLQQKVRSYLQKNIKKQFTPLVTSVKTALIRIVFGHVYPRLDVNVSKHLNHLLKSPFCVHPKTGKVCVPIDPERADGFDCNDVPHVLQLHEELNAARAQMSDDGDAAAKITWQNTSLKPHIEHFKEFVTKLMNASRAENPRSYAKQAGAKAEKEVSGSELF